MKARKKFLALLLCVILTGRVLSVNAVENTTVADSPAMKAEEAYGMSEGDKDQERTGTSREIVENPVPQEGEAEPDDAAIQNEIVDGSSSNQSSAFNISNNYSGYYYGEITNADGLNGLGIDGEAFETSEEFDFNKAVVIWVGENKKAVFKFQNGIVVDVYAENDICSPKVTLKTNPTEVFYQNNAFNVNEFNIVVTVSYVLNQSYSFIPTNILSNIKTHLTGMKIVPTTEGLNFGSNGFWIFKNDITEITETLDQSLACGSKVEFSYTINIDENYKLDSASSVLGLEVTAIANSKEFKSESKVTVGNLDYQMQESKNKKANTATGKAAAAANVSIKKDAKKNVALDAKISDYFDKEQLSYVQEFLYTYAATVMSSTSSSYGEPEKVRDKIYKRLGIDTSMLTIVNGTIASVDLKTNTKLGQRRIHFTVSLGSYRLGKSETYAGMGKIEYAVFKGNTPDPECNGTGIITYTNIKEFVNNLKSIAENAILDGYNSIWGNSANKIADYLTQGTIVEALKKEGIIGEFSNNVFKLLEYPTEHYLKVGVKCPVDVKIYDLNGTLCGSITNNVIDTNYHDIFMTVSDDEKYIYISNNNYYLEVTGNGEGVMNYTIEEYSEDGTKIRTISYDNLPVMKGKTYIAPVPDAAFLSSDLYNLTDSSGKDIPASSDTTLMEEDVDSVSWGEIDNVLYIYGKGTLSLNKDWKYNNTIKKVVFVDGEIAIGKDTFEECERLEEIVLNDCVTSIGDGSIYNCTNLEKITISKSVTSIGKWVFWGCGKLKEVGVDENNQQYCTADGFLFNKEKTELVFSPLSKEVIHIPDSVTVLNECAFYNSSGSKVKELTLGNGVQSIREFEFRRCEELNSVTIGSGVNSIGSEIFYSNVKTINFIGNLPKDISESAFEGIVAKAYYPSSWETVPEPDAFGGYLIWIPQGSEKDINDMVVASGSCSEQWDSSLEWELKGSGTLRIYGSGEMGNYSYEDSPWWGYRYGIKTIIMEEGINYIGVCAFKGCISLKNVVIPKSVKSIADEAFQNTPWEKEQGEFIISNEVCYRYVGESKVVSIPDGVVSIGEYMFSYAKHVVSAGYECNITSVRIPESVTTIGEHAFSYCTKLKNITIPKKVTEIENGTFSGCRQLESITLPDGLLNIGERAFINCVSLKEIIMKGNAPRETESDTFADCHRDLTVYVPKGAVGYDVAPWSDLNIVYTGGDLDIPIKSINLNKTNVSINKGESITLEVTIDPENTTDSKEVEWTSNNTKVATVKNGKVTAESVGTAVITASAVNGKSTTCTVTVKNPLKSISLNQTSAVLYKGETVILKVSYTPDDTTDSKTVKWSSSNTENAIVENGKVTAIKAGKVVITAKVGNNAVQCKVEVKELEPVSNLKAISIGKNKTKITWNASKDAEGYLVYAQKNGKYGYCGMVTNGLTYSDTKALDKDYNFYWVFPYLKDRNGKMLPGGCAKYVYAKGTILAVTNLKATSQKDCVRLAWSASAGAEGYLVYGKTAAGKYGYIGMTTKGTSYVDKKASKKEYNFYWVFPYHRDNAGNMIVGGTSKYVYGKAK